MPSVIPLIKCCKVAAQRQAGVDRSPIRSDNFEPQRHLAGRGASRRDKVNLVSHAQEITKSETPIAASSAGVIPNE